MKKLIILIVSIVIFQSCTVLTRCVKYYEADITDHEIFPYEEINTGNNKFHFKDGDKSLFEKQIVENKDSIDYTLDEYLKTGQTTAFLVIKNDSVLFEKYYKGYERSDISTFFSVSKSVTSLLVGIAVDEGAIKSVKDPVTDYIPELKDGDSMFKKLTIEHLLNMRSGIDFDESYSNPFSGMATLYYGTNQLAKIKRKGFKCAPGTKHEYQSVSTAILGIILERATGKKMAKYLEEKVWIPMGMENRATWSVDDKRHRSPKAYSGLNATAIDLAKIGRLYLNKGNWNGKQILSEDWVKKSFTPNVANDGYQYQWYSFQAHAADTSGNKFFQDSLTAVQKCKPLINEYKYYYTWENSDREKDKIGVKIYTGQYYALGLLKQILYIDPSKNLIIVRLGEGANFEYTDFMYKIGAMIK